MQNVVSVMEREKSQWTPHILIAVIAKVRANANVTGVRKMHLAKRIHLQVIMHVALPAMGLEKQIFDMYQTHE